MGQAQTIAKVSSETQTPSAGQIVERWQAELDVRPSTKAGYERAMRSFVAWMDARGLALTDATRADLIAYRDYLNETYGASTAQAYLVPVRGLYRWLANLTHTPSIAEGIRGPRTSKNHKRDALTQDQARRTVAMAEDRAASGDLASLRDAALYELLMTCGLRTVEAVRADVGDLRTMGGRRVLAVQGKGRDDKDEWVALSDKVARSIDRYLAARGNTLPDEPLFIGHGNRNQGKRLTTRWVSSLCKESMRRAGIDSPRLTAHSLRHTAVTAALMNGATVQQAQAMARHSKIETTMIYAHNLDRLDSPAEIVAADYLMGE